MHFSFDKFISESPSPDERVSDSFDSTYWKRALDVTCCLLALPALALLTLAMQILIRIVSPGPVFFRQQRVGYRGQLFNIYKFRTMKMNTDPAQHREHVRSLVGSNAPMEKLDTKNRHCLIPGAWLLRASGLDELPQIINVLKGEMSIVGPRPCLPAEYEMYLPWQLKRFDAQPGLTGLWQVSGKNRTTFDQMIRLDIQYATSKTWILDIKIIFMTVPALLTQVIETRTGKRSSAISPHTIPPYVMPPEKQSPGKSP
jgi:lipopolysaccharide/colanic/teichoic acid biosynthesis glycosyltransferase